MATKQLTLEDVIHLARLAHLTLTDKEIETYQTQLSSIIDYIGKLNELNTDNVDPANQVTGLSNILRDDEINPERALSQDEVLSNKNDTKQGKFEVDAILQNNE